MLERTITFAHEQNQLEGRCSKRTRFEILRARSPRLRSGKLSPRWRKHALRDDVRTKSFARLPGRGVRATCASLRVRFHFDWCYFGFNSATRPANEGSDATYNQRWSGYE